jgi:tryptophan-rich sensory protein
VSELIVNTIQQIQRVKGFYQKNIWSDCAPSYSLPVWAWFIMGGLNYVVCFAIVYRLLSPDYRGVLCTVALVLVLVIMGINALWSFFFLRMKSLFLSFAISVPYRLISVVSFICPLQFDHFAAWFLLPYLLYLALDALGQPTIPDRQTIKERKEHQ